MQNTGRSCASMPTPSRQRRRSILPKILEPLRTQFRIAHHVHDVLVPEVLLGRARVLPVTGELESTGMTEHVRMNREGEFGEFAGARH